MVVDSLVCGLFPLIYIVLREYDFRDPCIVLNSSTEQVVQGHRFDIFEDIGCFPVLYNTLPTYFISLMWPLAIGCVSSCYCGMSSSWFLIGILCLHLMAVFTIRAFVHRQVEFASILAAHPSITRWRYFRLMALAMTDLLLTMPLAIFVMWLNATATPMQPWRSWNDTHFQYSRVIQYPGLIWRRNARLVASMEFTRWVVPICALVFFGLAEEATRNYVSLADKIQKKLKLRTQVKHRSILMLSSLWHLY